MQGPFPERITVPGGLVKIRLIMGVPRGVWAALIMAAAVPPFLFGSWWPLPVILGLGSYIAYEARHDPQFLLAWASELRFKQRYD